MTRCLFVAFVLLIAGCEQPSRPKWTPIPQSPTMFVFTASWCGACQQQRPIVAQIQAAGVRVSVYDVDQDPTVWQKYDITALPTYILFRLGESPFRTHSAVEVLRLIGR